MEIWWNSISSFEKFFWALAIPFTSLFVIQMGMLIFGLDNSMDTPDTNDFIDMQCDIDMETELELDPNVPLKLITFRNTIIFFTIFSWTGIMGARQNYSKVITVLLGIILGELVIFILSSVYQLIFKLTENGNINLKDAIGTEGEVYLTVHDKGKRGGKIQVIFQSSLREVPAITYGKELKTGTKIKVIGVEGDVLVIEEIRNHMKGEIRNG